MLYKMGDVRGGFWCKSKELPVLIRLMRYAPWRVYLVIGKFTWSQDWKIEMIQ